MPALFWLLLLGTIAIMKTRNVNINLGGVLSGTARGIRNNNPLNIRIGNNWQGETVGTDKEFEVFSHHRYGFRAAAKLLRNYQSLYKLQTIDEIIHRFAPPNENHTSNYAGYVAKKMGVATDTPINLTNDKTLATMMLYMSEMEVGKHYSYGDAWAGVQLA